MFGNDNPKFGGHLKDYDTCLCKLTLTASIKFFLPLTIIIISDVLVTNLITKLYKSCLVAMSFQTMLAGMKFSIRPFKINFMPRRQLTVH